MPPLERHRQSFAILVLGGIMLPRPWQMLAVSILWLLEIPHWRRIHSMVVMVCMLFDCLVVLEVVCHWNRRHDPPRHTSFPPKWDCKWHPLWFQACWLFHSKRLLQYYNKIMEDLQENKGVHDDENGDCEKDNGRLTRYEFSPRVCCHLPFWKFVVPSIGSTIQSSLPCSSLSLLLSSACCKALMLAWLPESTSSSPKKASWGKTALMVEQMTCWQATSASVTISLTLAFSLDTAIRPVVCSIISPALRAASSAKCNTYCQSLSSLSSLWSSLESRIVLVNKEEVELAKRLETNGRREQKALTPPINIKQATAAAFRVVIFQSFH